MVRSMMSQTTLPKFFWDYALETAARILNMVPTKKVDKTPYEIWHGQAPKLSYLKVWGCEALVKRDTLTKPDKLDPRSFRCIFVGYPKETMGYSFYNPSENKVFVARNAEFFESKLLDLKASGSVEDLELIQEEDTNPSVDTSLNHEEDDQEIDEPQSDINPIRRSTRTRRPTDRLCLYIDTEEHELGDLGEPANYKAALLDPESKKWLDAMNVEMQSMKDNDVWVLVELPPNARTVGSKWLFKKKTDMDGAVYIFKARLVAKGFTQTYGVDYEETFSPVADIRAIRILIAIAAYYDYEIWQMDVKTAFLNGHLSEEVYMEQPEGFVNPKYPNHVCKLKRSIYGLKQASRQWNKRFDDEIKKFGFTQNPDEPCVYLKASGSYVAILILYVDDILLMGNNIPMLQDVKSYLGRSFAMKDLGDAAYILGIKIYRDRSKRLIGLNQSAYIEKILKRFYMENSKRGTIPMQEKLKLSKSQGASTPAEKQRMQNIPYASAKYEKFSISNEETINSGFTRFNAIVTSLKSLDLDYSSKNHMRKFLRALPLKWRAKVTAIEELKDLATLPLDELIGNLKVYEMVLDNNGVASKITTKEKVKSLALKAKVTSDSKGESDEDIDEEEAETFNFLARNFRKFFRKGNQFGRGNRFGNGANRFGKGCGNSFGNKGGESSKPKGACYNCGIEGHFASECRKPKENKAFIGGAWSDSENENEKILKFNKDFAKTFENLLKEKQAIENQNSKLSSKINDLEIEVKKLAINKEVVEPCKNCDVLTKE
ncbi:retrotransposon protein, putative, ty1-copia subclass, partial [Tanacetum coccineum]